MHILFKKSPLLSACTSIMIFALVVLVSFNGFLFAQVQKLPAPTISVENPVVVNTPELSLSWDILDDTTKYAFELCLDTACSQKVKSYSNLSFPGLTISGLESGQYFWRVSGVDENKILGLYSSPQPLLVNIIPPLDEDFTAIGEQEKLLESPNDKPDLNALEKDLKTTIFNLPWYIYLIALAYLIFFVKTLIWYLNK